MATVNVVDKNSNAVEEVSLSDKIFQQKPHEQIVHEVVRGQMAARRAGTSKAKTRGEVNRTNAKPYRQKGTGRARAGSERSPIRVGGGVIFGPAPRSFAYKIPKKIRRKAVVSVLSQKLADGNIIVVDDMNIESGKTKDFVSVWHNLVGGQKMKTLIILPEKNDTLWRSCRNIGLVKLTFADKLSVYDLLHYDKIIMTKHALPKIEEVYGS